jgi:hypothetical protein
MIALSERRERAIYRSSDRAGFHDVKARFHDHFDGSQTQQGLVFNNENHGWFCYCSPQNTLSAGWKGVKQGFAPDRLDFRLYVMEIGPQFFRDVGSARGRR